VLNYMHEFRGSVVMHSGGGVLYDVLCDVETFLCFLLVGMRSSISFGDLQRLMLCYVSVVACL
jgi:hypothetical protein